MDELNKPTEDNLRKTLGLAYDLYRNVTEMTKSFTAEWKYASSSGWILKVFNRKNSLFYLIPLDEELKIRLTLRESERDSFLKDSELKNVHEQITSSKKSLEGYAMEFDVSNNKELQSFKVFLEKLLAVRA